MLDRLLPPNSKRRNFVKNIYLKIFFKYSEEERIYKKWIKKNEPNCKELKLQRKTEFKIRPKISIVVPVFNTPKKFFDELVKSLQNQTYSNWELCLADGSPKKIEFIEKYVKKDSRIKYKFIGKNKGISGNTNEALTLVTGDFIGLLDHDDLLPKFSLFEVVKAINENPDVEFLYSDEDKLETANGPRYGVFFKPDFSPFTLNSANYICHFSIFKKELMDKLQGFRSEYDGSQDFDIVARASELTANIVHIPKVLYHWRAHKNSTAQNSDSKPYAFEIGKKVIKDHIKRSLGVETEVTDGLTPGSYEVKYIPKTNPLISEIVDLSQLKENESKKIENIIKEIKKSTYKNIEIILIFNKKIDFKSLNLQNIDDFKIIYIEDNNKFKTYNKAVLESNGDYFIIFDENLLKIDKENYIEDLLGICQNNNVGIVGTKLYNNDNLVEHSGIVIGMNGTGDFLYKGIEKNTGTYMQRLLIIHDVSAVLIKYAMIKKDTFNKIGGFTQDFTGLNVSIDTCLKILSLNLQVVVNPIISIKVEKLSDTNKEKEEENVFIKKWNKIYEKGDIYFSPNLSKNNTFLSLNI